MNYLFKCIIVLTLITGCTSLPDVVEVKNELHIPKILLPNAPSVVKLEDYEIDVLTIDKKGFMCLDGKNFKIVGNNDDKKDLYIKELEDQLNYLREVVRKQNKESEKKN